MSKATREEMKLEALRLMKLLNMGDEVLDRFEQTNVPYLSYSAKGSARAFYEDEMEVIADAEERYDQEIMIYHVIRNKAFGEDMLTMLYVSQEKDEWSGNFTQLNDGSFLTYAYVESPMEDGVGSVVIAPAEGPGIVRIG